MRLIRLRLAALGTAVVLAACGGGGGSGITSMVSPDHARLQHDLAE